VSPNIDFDLVDDILTLSPEVFCNIVQDGRIGPIAPIVEFVYHGYSTIDQRLKSLPISPVAQQLEATIRSEGLDKAHNPISGRPRKFEFIPTPQNEGEVLHPKWAAYLIRAQNAAEDSGIEKHLAQALIGTLEEMADNIVWHSEAPQTGIAGYRAYKGAFEYVVADAGIGILNSLRTNPRWSEIIDPEEAMDAALQNGTTRFPGLTRRGTGFNALVRNIAKKCSDLRFHSDTSCMVFEGISAYQNSLPLRQKKLNLSMIQGLIVSVVCRTPYM
jgi:anti-sigma regulatory factor (Ser/Thr protein kinase)